MKLISSIIALGALVGCGSSVTEEEFTSEIIVISCDNIFECTPAEDIEAAGEFWFFGADSAECQAIFNEAMEADTGADTGSECVFNAEQAQLCLDAYETYTCDDFNAGTTPVECETVCE